MNRKGLGRERDSWKKFIAQLEHNLHKLKPATYKLLKYFKCEVRLTSDSHFPLDEDLCLQYYQQFWTGTNYEQETLRTYMYEEEIIIIDEIGSY
jgi:hypothetical protein